MNTIPLLSSTIQEEKTFHAIMGLLEKMLAAMKKK